MIQVTNLFGDKEASSVDKDESSIVEATASRNS